MYENLEKHALLYECPNTFEPRNCEVRRYTRIHVRIVIITRFYRRNIERYASSHFRAEEECVSPDIIDSDARVRNADVASRI